MSVNFEKFTSTNEDSDKITVERLEGCDWSRSSFKEVNFSKLKNSNQIFRNDFVCIHYPPGEMSAKIIKWNFFTPYELSMYNTIYCMI